jgi:DNA-binding HxlR family transcriptional regulator
MLGNLYDKQDCSAARALEHVGERWSLLILRDAMFRGATRFNEFARTLEIAPNILSKRLAGFVEDGLMEMGADGAYRLTAKGMDLKPVIVALTQWGDKWVSPGPVVFVEHETGAPVSLDLRLGDGEPIADPGDVRVRPNPAYRPRQR